MPKRKYFQNFNLISYYHKIFSLKGKVQIINKIKSLEENSNMIEVQFKMKMSKSILKMRLKQEI